MLQCGLQGILGKFTLLLSILFLKNKKRDGHLITFSWLRVGGGGVEDKLKQFVFQPQPHPKQKSNENGWVTDQCYDNEITQTK